jgi:hypothetical protein
VFRLKPPRADFAQTMTDEERAVMSRHAEYWKPYLDSGRMVIFGPVLTDASSFGLGVVEGDEDELREFATRDPAVTSGTVELEVGKLIAGHVRPA